MEREAYSAYAAEAGNWLHAGRSYLIASLLKKLRKDGSTEILEVGAGVGQNIPVLAQSGSVDALEIDPHGLEQLRGMAALRSVIDQPIPAELDRSYDVIGAFDVIEHLEDDHGAVDWIFDNLKPGGLFIATVPAYQWLYSDHDRALNHYRRYSLTSFTKLLPPDAERLTASYFNMLLFPAVVAARTVWQLKRRAAHGSAQKKQSVPSMGAVDRVLLGVLMSEARLVGRGMRLPFGLSLCVCARKPDTAPK